MISRCYFSLFVVLLQHGSASNNERRRQRAKHTNTQPQAVAKVRLNDNQARGKQNDIHDYNQDHDDDDKQWARQFSGRAKRSICARPQCGQKSFRRRRPKRSQRATWLWGEPIVQRSFTPSLFALFSCVTRTSKRVAGRESGPHAGRRSGAKVVAPPERNYISPEQTCSRE